MIPSEFLLIDKPTDWTSHDVVGYLRRVTGIKKIGHAGTLDPFATGLLIVGVGRAATKRLDEFKGMPKEYIATVQLGAVSDTQDVTGNITHHEPQNTSHISEATVRSTLHTFTGKQTQIPPMYSAKKVQGKKLYELARAGKEIARDPIEIEIFDIKLRTVILSKMSEMNAVEGSPRITSQEIAASLLSVATDRISRNDNTIIDSFTICVSCSTGTYIRTLCHDIGQALGVGAYCAELRRTKIGAYSVDKAMLPTQIERTTWQQQLVQY